MRKLFLYLAGVTVLSVIIKRMVKSMSATAVANPMVKEAERIIDIPCSTDRVIWNFDGVKAEPYEVVQKELNALTERTLKYAK